MLIQFRSPQFFFNLPQNTDNVGVKVEKRGPKINVIHNFNIKYPALYGSLTQLGLNTGIMTLHLVGAGPAFRVGLVNIQLEYLVSY